MGMVLWWLWWYCGSVLEVFRWRVLKVGAVKQHMESCYTTGFGEGEAFGGSVR